MIILYDDQTWESETKGGCIWPSADDSTEVDSRPRPRLLVPLIFHLSLHLSHNLPRISGGSAVLDLHTPEKAGRDGK
jgi:hypothetical protein